MFLEFLTLLALGGVLLVKYIVVTQTNDLTRRESEAKNRSERGQERYFQLCQKQEEVKEEEASQKSGHEALTTQLERLKSALDEQKEIGSSLFHVGSFISSLPAMR